MPSMVPVQVVQGSLSPRSISRQHPPMKYQDVLKKYKRVAVIGGPITGKSIVTDHTTDRPVIHSDDYSGRPWSEHSTVVKDACSGLDSFVVAGIAADRAVRKGLEVDAVIHCKHQRASYPKKGQAILKKQIDRRARRLAHKYPVYDLEE